MTLLLFIAISKKFNEVGFDFLFLVFRHIFAIGAKCNLKFLFNFIVYIAQFKSSGISDLISFD